MIAGLIGAHGFEKAQKPQSGLILLYVAFVAAALYTYHVIAEQEFSAFLTLSALCQCLAFSLLGIQMLSTDTVAGISAKTLWLDAFAVAGRLSSTLFFEGYLPYDQTGDWMYQALDVISLAMVLCVLYHVLIAKRRTYEEDKDVFPAMELGIGAFVLAILFHGNLDERPFFDTLWMFGLFASVVSVLPQLWMMTQHRGGSPALMGHFVAAMAMARVLSGVYMWHAYPEVVGDPWFGFVQYTGYAVIIAHAVHLLLLGDFAYYYCKNIAKSGLGARLDLSNPFHV
jgi:hypothetical protein